MKKSLLSLICLAGSAFLTSCTTITVDAPQPAELSLGRGARVSIVPEAGSDAGEMAHALFQLFANQGYYPKSRSWEFKVRVKPANFRG
jgi:hypothetical protein